jgi:predicted transglutaminase-like cysteine proteinase
MQVSKFVKRAIGLMLLGLGLAGAPATAAQPIDFTNAAFAPASGATTIPIGAVDFCRRYAGECRPNGRIVEDFRLTPRKWQHLLDVNTHFNLTIMPETDMQLYHVEEFWTYPHGFGDCEDIALAKRRQLIEDGWPASTLLMTVVKESDGEGHAVLMVRTDRGDLILDNQDSIVRDWKDSPYHFLKRQSQNDPGAWVAITDSRPNVIIAGTGGQDDTASTAR